MEKVIEKLEQNNCIQLNLKLIQIIGIIPSIVFSLLLEKMKFSKEYPFHYSIDELMEKSTLSRARQSKALKKLYEVNLISVERKGIPYKRYFSINFNEVEKILK